MKTRQLCQVEKSGTLKYIRKTCWHSTYSARTLQIAPTQLDARKLDDSHTLVVTDAKVNE